MHPVPALDRHAVDGTSEGEILDPRLVPLLGDDYDFREMVEEADEGVGGFGEGELLTCVFRPSRRRCATSISSGSS